MTATESPPVSASRLSLAVTAPRPATVHQAAAPAGEPPAAAAAPGKARRRGPPLTLRDWVWRTVAWSLLAGSVGLLLWTYQQLVPAQQRLREASTRVSRLSAEIAVMEGRYSPADIEQLAAEYRGAIELLFSTPESLAEWLQEIRAQAVPLAFDTTPEFSRLTPEAQGRTNTGSAYEPATLSLLVQPKLQVEGCAPPTSGCCASSANWAVSPNGSISWNYRSTAARTPSATPWPPSSSGLAPKWGRKGNRAEP
ncbi:MAG: hypothetical protein M5U12_23725 [Verrucomicrobia bacterium]|nr:hypothetical protein [Verrucomicrobiota bacterium]